MHKTQLLWTYLHLLHLYIATKHDQKKSHLQIILQGRKSIIYCETHLSLFGLFRYDLKWVSIIGIKWTRWDAWIRRPFSFIWCFMQTCTSTRRWQFTILFECKINLLLYSSQNCTGHWTFLKTYMYSVIFELFHILEDRERNDLFYVTYIF